MATSVCPFCNLSFPISQLERHVNDHLTEAEFQRDLDLACQLSCAASTPTPPSKNISSDRRTSDLSYADSSVGETSGSGLLSNSNDKRDLWDLELAYQISLQPSPIKVQTSVSRASTSDHGEENILENISHLSLMQIRSTFYKVEGGLMVFLRRCLELEQGNTISFITDHVDHYQSLQSEDKGFGCGWRNIQMLSSHLLVQRPETRDVLFGGSGFVPEIAFLQRWLEIAWERGFDISGSVEFNNEVYGSRKWIGTTECATLFRSFGLRARIVDFDRGKRQTGKGFGPMDKFLVKMHNPQERAADHERSNHVNSHPVCVSDDSTFKNHGKTNSDSVNKSTSTGHRILMEWVWKYFSDNNPIRNVENRRRVHVSKKTPLYFQHQGHSRTVIGIQARQQHGMPEQYTLLCFDPGHRTVDLEKSLRDNYGWQRLIKRGVHTLRKPQYQLCYIDPGIASAMEMEQLKIIDSISC